MGTEMHVNRTGIAAGPERARAMREIDDLIDTTAMAPTTVSATAASGAHAVREVRIRYADTSGDVGSMPPPATAWGADRAARRGGAVLLDVLGERLAFERWAVRFDEALIAKHDAYGSWEGGPSREELERMRADELTHFFVVWDILEAWGADASAVTPAADLQMGMHRGLALVLADPRATLRHAIDAALIQKLVDVERWEAVEDLAFAVGEDDLVPELAHLLEAEREHLATMRRWVAAGLSGAATGGLAASFVARAARRASAATLATGGRVHVDAAPRAGRMSAHPPSARKRTATVRARVNDAKVRKSPQRKRR